jgi:ParB/RepB/Spo0J family partition protein
MEAVAAVAPISLPPAQEIDFDLVDEDPKNYRKNYNPERLKELADSVKAQGIVEPLLGRPNPKKPGHVVLVFGHRRRRAAKIAGLAKLPVIVKELTELQVVELRAAENGHRDDLHPLEEAELFRDWHEVHKVPVETIAGRVGKKKGYVYGRLKLLELAPRTRELFQAQRFEATTALQLARIGNPKLQEKAAAEIAKEGEPMSFLEAQRYIRERFMLSLAAAPFPTADPTLYPTAGACGDCPKRSGNQRDLFPSQGEPDDTCTDPDCFGEKREAAWKRATEEAKAKGHEVLSDAKVKKIMPYAGTYLDRHSGYVLADSTCYEDKKNRSYKELLGEKAPLVLARKDGKLVELFASDGLKAALKEAGHDFAKKKKEERAKAKTDKKAAKPAKPVEPPVHTQARVVDAAVGAIVKKLEENEAKALRLLVLERADYYALSGANASEGGCSLFRRRKIEPKKNTANEIDGLFGKLVAKLNAPQLVGLLFELEIFEDVDYDGTHNHLIEKMAKALGVDVKKIEKQVGEELKKERQLEKEREEVAAEAEKIKATQKAAKGGKKKGARR